MLDRIALKTHFRMLHLSLRQNLGKKFYFLPWLVLVWPVYHAVRMLESGQVSFSAPDAQNELIGLPIYILSIGLGSRIIASEVEAGTLETVYSVPGGTQIIWLWKILSSCFVLLLSTVILAFISRVLFTDFSIAAVVRVVQAGVFFLVVSMMMALRFKSEIAGAVATGSLLFVLYPRFYSAPWSPLFDPAHVEHSSVQELQIYLLQNHLAVIAAIIFVCWYAFQLAERREQLI